MARNKGEDIFKGGLNKEFVERLFLYALICTIYNIVINFIVIAFRHEFQVSVKHSSNLDYRTENKGIKLSKKLNKINSKAFYHKVKTLDRKPMF